jgi:hypothetical protein
MDMYAFHDKLYAEQFLDNINKMNSIDLLSTTDFKTLRNQKVVLLEMLKTLKGKRYEAVQGIIHLLDAYQDAAVNEGYSEEEVFGERKIIHCHICETAWIETTQEIQKPIYRCRMCNLELIETDTQRYSKLPKMNCLDEFITDSGN